MLCTDCQASNTSWIYLQSISLRLPFNASASIGWELRNVRRTTNTVETDYAIDVFGLASPTCMHAHLHLIH